MIRCTCIFLSIKLAASEPAACKFIISLHYSKSWAWLWYVNERREREKRTNWWGEGGDMDQGCEVSEPCRLLEETDCYFDVLRVWITYLHVGYCHLWCDAVWSNRMMLTFRNNLLPPTLGYLNPEERLTAVRTSNPELCIFARVAFIQKHE